MSDISRFVLNANDFHFTCGGLSRPECVIAESDGTFWVSDNRAAVTRIDPDGKQTLLGGMRGAPNGLAMDRSGRLYVANIGDGRLYQLERDGNEKVLLEQFEGAPLGAVNFVYVDDDDHIWVTVSTTTVPRHDAISKPRPDGYILRLDQADAAPTRVASGFHFTNEVRIDPSKRHLYVVETALGRVVRLPISADGSLGAIEPFGPNPLFPGARPDGITFDSAGNLWVTEIAHNMLFVIEPNGKAHKVYEDPDGKVLSNPTSLTFAGQDLSIAYVGSLKGECLAYFRAPVPGAPMAHWSRRH